MVDDSALFVPVTLILYYGLLYLVARVFLLTVIRHLQAGRQRPWWRKWWQRAVAPEPGAESQLAEHRSPQCEPWSPCSEADQKLQQLLLSGLPQCKTVLGPDFLQAAWRDLEELVANNNLSCHCCSSPEVQSGPGKGKVESLNVEPSTVCSPGAAWISETRRDLKLRVAQRSLQVQQGSLPERVLLSQQQAWGRQCRHILPKLIKSGQTQPLLRGRMCPWLKGKGDCITGNILKREEIRKWGDPNPTEISMYRLVQCPPRILPRNMGLIRKVILQKAHVQGQAEQQEHPRKEQQCRPKESAIIPLPPSHKQERPTATAALPCLAIASGLKDTGCQTDSAGLRVTDIKASSQQLRAALATISKLQLSQETFRKLSMHTARKCLQVKLKDFPVAVRKSMWQHSASQKARKYFHSRQALFLSEEKREALELHIRSMKLERLGNRLISGSPLKPAVSQEEESASTYVTAPPEAPWAEAGPSRGKSTWSATAERGGFRLVRRTFRGVHQITTTYRSSLLNACGDPDCDPVAAPTSKVVWGKICPIPEKPRVSASKDVQLACKGRIMQ